MMIAQQGSGILLKNQLEKNYYIHLMKVRNHPSFRDMVGKYQDPFPWLKFGIDLIMGSTSDKDASLQGQDVSSDRSAEGIVRNCY